MAILNVCRISGQSPYSSCLAVQWSHLKSFKNCYSQATLLSNDIRISGGGIRHQQFENSSSDSSFQSLVENYYQKGKQQASLNWVRWLGSLSN